MSRCPPFWVRVITLVLVLAPGTVFAGRPLDTEDTGTVEPGKAELELSGDFARNPNDGVAQPTSTPPLGGVVVETGYPN